MTSDRPTRTDRRRLVVLGSTGSIGTNTLDVVNHLRRLGQQDFELVGLAAGRSAPEVFRQAKEHGCPHVAIADASAAKLAGSPPPGMQVLSGPDAAEQLIEVTQPDVVMSAIVGTAGLSATVAGIRQGATIAVANKETLVAAGPWIMPEVRRHGATLLPVDSEHAAVFHCLQGQPPEQVRRIVLTASGGPFRNSSKEDIEQATPEQALRHPTWTMGPKITVDSATMMNKALEVIEAHHLFGLPSEKIAVVVHPQSVVHGMVEFTDHSVLASMGPPDMRTPIQQALTHPQRMPGCSQPMDWSKLSQLIFEPPDEERFSALRLARQVMAAGGSAGAVFSAANEAAVQAFLEHRIPMGRIIELVAGALEALPPAPVNELNDVLQADAAARRWVDNRLSTDASAATPQAASR